MGSSNGGTSEDAGNSVALDSVGNVYSTGYFTGMYEFIGTTLNSIGDVEIYVAKLNAKAGYSGQCLQAIKEQMLEWE